MPGPGTWAAGDILTAADLNAIGTWASYTPTLSQNGTRTATVNHAEYCLINKMCIVNVDLTCTTTGSAANRIAVSLPITAATSTNESLGTGLFFDSSASDVMLTIVRYFNTTTVAFMTEATTSTTGYLGADPNVTLENNDVISFSIVYQTA